MNLNDMHRRLIVVMILCLTANIADFTSSPTLQPTKSPTNAGCRRSIRLDLIFILDSSNSVYDPDAPDPYHNWQSEIDFAKGMVNSSSFPSNSRIGAINFAGCIPMTFEQCRDQGQLIKMWGLNTYGNPANDKQAVYDSFDSMGSDDFLAGYTWTDEALFIALNEFNANSSESRTKMIILLTDGQPWRGHEPCNSTGYISPTLQSLQNQNVTIIVVGINVNNATITDFFSCMVQDFEKHFFDAPDFDALDGIVDFMINNTMNPMICSSAISLVINEVELKKDYNGSGQHLFFVELYNDNIGVSLNGFEFRGMINYKFTQQIDVSTGQYWVISTYDMDNINQIECRNCSQDLLIDPIYANDTMDNMYWKLELLDAVEQVIDAVERNSDDESFPVIIDDLYTFELQSEDLDNDIGSNWEKSCYIYGTPQQSNQEFCIPNPTTTPTECDNSNLSEWRVDYIGKSTQFRVYDPCDGKFIKLKMSDLTEYDGDNDKKTKHKETSFASSKDWEWSLNSGTIQDHNGTEVIYNEFIADTLTKSDAIFELETIFFIDDQDYNTLKFNVNIRNWQYYDDDNYLVLCIDIMTNNKVSDVDMESGPDTETFYFDGFKIDNIKNAMCIASEDGYENITNVDIKPIKDNINHLKLCYNFSSCIGDIEYDPVITMFDNEVITNKAITNKTITTTTTATTTTTRMDEANSTNTFYLFFVFITLSFITVYKI